jgi:hypothetical protein
VSQAHPPLFELEEPRLFGLREGRPPGVGADGPLHRDGIGLSEHGHDHQGVSCRGVESPQALAENAGEAVWYRQGRAGLRLRPGSFQGSADLHGVERVAARRAVEARQHVLGMAQGQPRAQETAHVTGVEGSKLDSAEPALGNDLIESE